mgnify:FL=1
MRGGTPSHLFLIQLVDGDRRVHNMNELRYQLDLLKAMNQKLSARERMYQIICDTVSSAFLYYSFEKNEIVTLGKWHDFFDFDIRDIRETEKIFDMVDEQHVMSLRDAFYPEKRGEISAATDCMLKDSRIWLRFNVHIVYDVNGQPADKIINIDNITTYKSQNEELKYMAYYDDLTGLYNRNYFVHLLGNFLRKAEDENSIVSVLILDIDDFRKVNDGLGIIIGDELVQLFGAFLKELCDENIIVCHLNSDVYCMAIYNPVGSRSVETIHHAIQQRTREAFRLSGGQELKITVSVGVAEYPEAAQSALELINCAEIVMFKGKKALGKNRIQYFNAPILQDFMDTVEMENKLKEAVFNKSFELNYQPQYYAGNQRLRGLEVLIRWQDTPGHYIPPSFFIPLAEKTGSILAIGRWVVEQSISQYAKWQAEYGADFILSINISAVQFSKDNCVEGLMEILNRYQVDPGVVELEITESILIDNFKPILEKLKILKEYGVKISLDDFGTGFSSLSYLKELPIDTLKIDKSFIDTVLSDSATRIITESIINMVKALGFESIAEGVEQEQQYEYLHAIGCDVIQGFFFGKPQSSEQIEELLRSMI